jgi:phospholipid/cholesterol/gamma-HCH transport system substrate-binding protein
MRLDSRFNKIPDDSDASIQTQGLLGGKYVGLTPGGSETYLKDGSQIEFTQSAIVLESLVNKFFANMAGKSPQAATQSQEKESEK